MKKLFIFFVAAAMIVAFTVPAAADWNFYGHARVATWSDDVSKEATGTGFDDTDTTWALQSNARIGANVETGDIKGRFEYGTGVNLRLLYGDWNFGGGTFRVGQFYTPTTYFYSNQVHGTDDGLFAVGNPYGGRLPGLQLAFGGFKIAFLSPNASGATSFAGGDQDTTLPKIEASFNLPIGPASLDFYGGYNSYDEVDALDSEEGVSAYLVGMGGTVNAGPATIAFRIYTMENPRVYGIGSAIHNHFAIDLGTDWVVDSYEDIDEVGGCLVVGFKAGDALSLEGGVGYQQVEYDYFDQELAVMAYYVQAKITLADNFFIVPEVGGYDYGDLETKGFPDVKLGDMFYFGAKWEMRF